MIQVMGEEKGVVLETSSPILVRWSDEAYLIINNDKTIMYYQPEKRFDGHGGWSEINLEGN